MAVKPIIKPITPFDATIGTRITASYSGNMPYYNRVIIQDAMTLETKYDRTIATSETAHTLDPSYSGYHLINGRRYTATIQFFGRTLADAGLVSDKISFLTRTTPQFYFDGVTDGMIIDTASIGLNLIYIQNEYEKLISFQFLIYDNNKHLLQETEIKYDTTDMTYTFRGLDNLTSYYVRALGSTKNGISLDTGYWEIRTQYENPSVYARMYVENDNLTSVNEYWTNFVMIESDEDEDSFRYEDSYIYLDNGETVTYSKGFTIEGDATWHIRAKDMDYERVFFRVLTEDGDGFYVEGIRDTDQCIRFRLVAPGSVSNYMLYTQSVFIDWADIINLWIRRIGDIYQMVLYVESENMDINNLYLEQHEPENPSGITMGNRDLWVDVDYEVEISNENVQVLYQKNEPADPNPYAIWIVDKDDD